MLGHIHTCNRLLYNLPPFLSITNGWESLLLPPIKLYLGFFRTQCHTLAITFPRQHPNNVLLRIHLIVIHMQEQFGYNSRSEMPSPSMHPRGTKQSFEDCRSWHNWHAVDKRLYFMEASCSIKEISHTRIVLHSWRFYRITFH